jgi:hypothetical protein
MAIKFNPLTGNFDFTGSGGGGGSSYIDGEVQNFSALPQTIGSPAVDSAYLVREAEGTWLLARKPAGIYIRTANTGVRADDWTHASAFPDVFNDANLVVYSNADSTKNLKFNVGSISTGTTRTITVPNANVTLPNQGTSTTDSPEFAGLSVANTGGDGVQLLVTNDDGVVSSIAPLSSEQRSEARTSLGLGTAALGDFAAPPAIGNTTPAAGTFTTLTANNGTLTASAPVLDLAQTWNASGTTFTGLRFNVTNTASATASNLLDIQVGGTTRMMLKRDGVLHLGQFTNSGFYSPAPSWHGSTAGLLAAGNLAIGSSLDTILERGGAGIIEQRNAANAQEFRIYNTFTSATNHERGFLKWSSNVFQIGTEKGSAGGTARGLEFQTDGVTRVSVALGSGLTGQGTYAVVGPYASTVGGDAAAQFNITTNSNSGYALFRFGTVGGATGATGEFGAGGSTAALFSNSVFFNTKGAYPLIFASNNIEYMRMTSAGDMGIGTTAATAKLHVVGTVLFNGAFTIQDANNIALGTTTGTKIGTATTQKIGFFNATPVVQQAAVADATNGQSTQDRLNDLLARLRTLGLIAT